MNQMQFPITQRQPPDLPVELLSRIFIAVACPCSREAHIKRPFIPTIRLAQVSQYWRQVASTTPQLWRCVVLRGPLISAFNKYTIQWSSKLLQRDIMAMRTSMELSAQLPLELIALNDYFLGQWNANSEYQRTFHSEFVPLLAGFISRCGSITLNDAIPSLLKCITVTEAIHGAANLRELYIRHSRYLCEKPVFRDGLILRLQTLQVADLGPYCSLFRMAPISELRQLILTKSGGTDFLDVLHVLPNLLNLEFLKAHIHSLNRQEIPESVAQNLPVALPTLREAVLHLVDYNQQWPHTPSSSWSFFVYLTAPILKVLHVAAVGTRDVSAAGKLGAFCERSPSLGIFKLETSLALDDIKAVIRAVSGLRSLVIPTIGKRSLNEVGVLLGFLTAGACSSNSKDSLLPCLEYLTVPGCDSVTPAGLLELFHSRCRQTASNKSISTSEGFASPDTHSPITATLKEVDFVTKSNQMDHFFQEDVLAQLQAGGCSLRWFPRYRQCVVRVSKR